MKIKGNFKKIIYSNNSFYVVNFKLHPNQNDLKKELMISEHLNSINVILDNNNFDFTLDYEIELDIIIKNNSKYKTSYIVKNMQFFFKTEKESIIRFLSSSLFKGISTKTSEKIVNTIGIDFINDIDRYKEDIINIIGNKKAEIIFEGINNNTEISNLTKEFTQNNLSINLLNIIQKKIKKNINNFLRNNIYSIIDHTLNIDFFDLDKVAKHYYLNYSEEESLDWLVIFNIYILESNESTINSNKEIFDNVSKYKNISIEDFKNSLKRLFINEKIIIHEDKISITSKSMYDKEKYIVNRIKKLIKNQLDYSINNDKIIYGPCDDIQKKAIINSLINPVSIITGSPGTGKTLLIKLIIENLKLIKGKNIELLTPTGKAATQINSNSNLNAKTFHSFLKWNKDFFEVNEKSPSKIQIAIIDEFSMIDINLFYDFLKGSPKLKHLIIIGDPNQLPPIGPGLLLQDFINSKNINLIELKKIYRQSEGSLIAKNSLLIKNNDLPTFDNKESILIDINSTNIESVENYLFSKNFDELGDYQILIPMYGGDFGINYINKIYQNKIHSNESPLFKLNEINYFKNDKVIQLENLSDKNIFNGEIGFIKNVNFDKNNNVEKIIINFGLNKNIEYSIGEFNQYIKLAYAISVHKFQGSECSDVVIILSNEHRQMLTKKLFYTAYTRAKNKVTIISTKEIIKYCINNEDNNRLSNILKLMKDIN